MRTLPIVALLTLTLAACVADPPLPGGDGRAEPPENSARVIQIDVGNWEFSPATVVAKKGEKVIVRLIGGDGRHGFAVPDLGINTAVASGKAVDIELPTDASGEFSFRCSVPCGPGHQDMAGTIVISD